MSDAIINITAHALESTVQLAITEAANVAIVIEPVVQDYGVLISNEILRGPTGPAGFLVQTTAPTNLSVLWVDSSDPGNLLLKAYLLDNWRVITSGGSIVDSTYFYFVDENDDYWVDENDDYFRAG
jgi:hypothetical protein